MNGDIDDRVQMRSLSGRFQRIIDSGARSCRRPGAWYEAQLTVLHVVPTFDPVQVRAELVSPSSSWTR